MNSTQKVDWDIVMEVSPTLLNGFCWLIWLLFLVLPALSGAHGTAAYSASQNSLYVGVGFVFCLTIREALKAGAGVRAVLFVLVLLILAYWF